MNKVEFGKDHYHKIEDMNRWLRANVGPGGWRPMLDPRWTISTAFGASTYTFKDKGDAMMFALKWA